MHGRLTFTVLNNYPSLVVSCHASLAKVADMSMCLGNIIPRQNASRQWFTLAWWTQNTGIWNRPGILTLK